MDYCIDIHVPSTAKGLSKCIAIINIVASRGFLVTGSVSIPHMRIANNEDLCRRFGVLKMFYLCFLTRRKNNFVATLTLLDVTVGDTVSMRLRPVNGDISAIVIDQLK
jgi:hypothetical protein